jgi:hypothetical protein
MFKKLIAQNYPKQLPYWSKKFWDELFTLLQKAGMVINCSYAGFKFRYGLMPSRYRMILRYNRCDQGQLIEPDILSLFARNTSQHLGLGVYSYTLVMERNTPLIFQQFIGLHEYIESIRAHTFDRHLMACYVQLKLMKLLSPGIYNSHAHWLLDYERGRQVPAAQSYFRALPGFPQYAQYHTPEKVMDDYLREMQQLIDHLYFGEFIDALGFENTLALLNLMNFR